MTDTIFTEYVIEEVICGACDIHFGLTRSFHDTLKKNGRSFYCPNGHNVNYGPSESENLRKQLIKAGQLEDQLRARIAEEQRRLGREQVSHSATKGLLTKAKKRTVGGACPACNRNFEELARHIATKHPGYKAEVGT